MSTEIGAAFSATVRAAEPAPEFRSRVATSLAGAENGVRAPSPRPQESPARSTETVTELASQVQRVFRDIELSVDPEQGEVVVRVRDRESGEVIRQIPAEELLRLARFMRDLQEAEAEPLGGVSNPLGREGFLLHTRA